MVTALIAVIFIYQLKDVVDILALGFFIAETNVAMKLALFHTVFNVLGVLLMIPFIKHLVRYLERWFVPVEKGRGIV